MDYISVNCKHNKTQPNTQCVKLHQKRLNTIPCVQPFIFLGNQSTTLFPFKLHDTFTVGRVNKIDVIGRRKNVHCLLLQSIFGQHDMFILIF